jgi:hypothetical protein
LVNKGINIFTTTAATVFVVVVFVLYFMTPSVTQDYKASNLGQINYGPEMIWKGL